MEKWNLISTGDMGYSFLSYILDEIPIVMRLQPYDVKIYSYTFVPITWEMLIVI